MECFVQGDVSGAELDEEAGLVTAELCDDVQEVIGWKGFVDVFHTQVAGGGTPF